MDKYPLLWNGSAIGELITEQDALYTCFTARCRLPGTGLWCAWAIGEQDELRLGVVEPEGKTACIRRRFSGRMTASLGRLQRGELRAAGEEAWEEVAAPERLFCSGWLRRQLHGVQGLLKQQGNRRFLALPYDSEQAFPLPAWFCFAHMRCIRGRWYVVYCVNEREWPCWPEEKG